MFLDIFFHYDYYVPLRNRGVIHLTQQPIFYNNKKAKPGTYVHNPVGYIYPGTLVGI